MMEFNKDNLVKSKELDDSVAALPELGQEMIYPVK
jgi:hypothetical protein